MNINEVEIRTDGIASPYKVAGTIEASIEARFAWSKTPTIDDIDIKLREAAMRKGANAVINVRYTRGVTATSWKALSAIGTAIILDKESDEVKCPYCAELIKREAIKCKHCGSELPKK